MVRLGILVIKKNKKAIIYYLGLLGGQALKNTIT